MDYQEKELMEDNVNAKSEADMAEFSKAKKRAK